MGKLGYKINKKGMWYMAKYKSRYYFKKEFEVL